MSVEPIEARKEKRKKKKIGQKVSTTAEKKV